MAGTRGAGHGGAATRWAPATRGRSREGSALTRTCEHPEHDGRTVVVGLVAAPGAPAALARSVQDALQTSLQEHLPAVLWQLQLIEDPLVQPPADSTELVSAARRLLLDQGWDLVVCLTDLPLQVGRRPVVAHASPVHGVALLAVPALGAVAVQRRARRTVLGLVHRLLGADQDPPDGPAGTPAGSRLGRRLRELGTDTETDTGVVRFTARVLTGLRLLLGMVRSNQPWRLAAGLSRALVGAAAAGVFALVTSDIWRLADALGPWRLTAGAVGSVLAITTTLIAGAGLWERGHHPRAREQVVLFNLATTATVLLGVLALYGGLFVLALLGALLLVVPALLAEALAHPAALQDYAELAWLTTSLATLGGALGAGLETDQAVQQAAYARRGSPPLG